MEENYPKDAAELKRSDRWSELTYEIEKEAQHLKDILREQYARVNPRPQEDFMEILKWENTRGFYVEHEIMEQIVAFCAKRIMRTVSSLNMNKAGSARSPLYHFNIPLTKV